MSRPGSGDTVNQGPAPERPGEVGTDLTGNVKRKGEDPSPDDRARGETSSDERAAPVDLDAARERAQ